MSPRAVIFDLGGVVLGSPLHALAAYERDQGLPPNAINRVVASTAPHGAWSRLERGEISMLEFFDAFERDCAEAGWTISARDMMERIGETSAPRPSMLEAIRRIRSKGLRVAALTNNWAPEGEVETDSNPLLPLFDVFLESSVEDLRKPDPRIYDLVCERLGVPPQEAVFLDDIGANLKPARAMGMTTLKVETPEASLEELAEILGFP
ncbi:MAG: HAD family phosphatase, partial [Myxococcota bacterium]